VNRRNHDPDQTEEGNGHLLSVAGNVLTCGAAIAKAGHAEVAREIYEYLVENHAGNHDAAWAQKNICNMYMDAGDDAGLAAAVETLATKFAGARTVTQALTQVGDWAARRRRFRHEQVVRPTFLPA